MKVRLKRFKKNDGGGAEDSIIIKKLINVYFEGILIILNN